MVAAGSVSVKLRPPPRRMIPQEAAAPSAQATGVTEEPATAAATKQAQ